MGVPGLWAAIATAQRKRSILASLSDASRIVIIDISIWFFQCSAAAGGKNSSLRTFYYRLCRLLRCGLHAIFIFDGADKPSFKRGKAVHGVVREFAQWKALIRAFGFDVWQAPGEAEAEAAHLQSLGIADTIISDDVDALLFGATKVYKSWAAIGHEDDRPAGDLSHTYVYEAHQILKDCHLDSRGMILVALLSGGDYFPAGVPGCGIKTAIQAAQAGFGEQLLMNLDNVSAWRASLARSLQENQEAHFTTKHPSLTLPANFPDMAILNHYISPVVSSPEVIEQRMSELRSGKTHKVDVQTLQELTMKLFEWESVDGHLKLIRTLAPAMLITEILTHLQHLSRSTAQCESSSEVDRPARALNLSTIMSICGSRTHRSTDNELEIRIEYDSNSIVNVGPRPAHTTTLVPTTEQTRNPKQETSSLVTPVGGLMRMWVSYALFESCYPEMIAQYESEKARPRTQATKQSKKQQSSLLDFYKLKKPGTVELDTLLTRTRSPTNHKNSLSGATQPQEAAIDIVSSTQSHKVPKSSLAQGRTRLTRNKTLDDSNAGPTIAKSRNKSTRSDVLSTSTATPIVNLVDDCASDTAPAAASTGRGSRSKQRSANLEPSTELLPAEANVPSTSRKIVLRESLPGNWRGVRQQDTPSKIHHIEAADVIDLCREQSGTKEKQCL